MRILIVGMAASVHIARWLQQFVDRDWDIHLFPVNDSRPHPDLRRVTVHSFSSTPFPGADDSVRIQSIWPVYRGSGTLVRMAKVLKPSLLDRSGWLARVIHALRPDVVHSHEIQHAGYLTLAARRLMGRRFPPWIVTNWGSDIYLFGRLREHVDQIRGVLANCDYYCCECQRDVALARNLGFQGEVLPIFPNPGGFDLEHLQSLRVPGPTSARRVVTLKGHQNWAGRALFGLRALELCSAELHGYEVAIYNADADVKLRAQLFQHATNIPVNVIPRSAHDEILRLLGRSRLYVGLSISDGTCRAFLEALAMGAFPIQSGTACADEWIESGRTGMIVPPEDPEIVAAAIRRALRDDALVDAAAERNAATAAARLDYQRLKQQAIDMYERVRAGGRRRAARTA